MAFRVEENADTKIIKDLFVEYSHIKGAESCFVSFDKELNEKLYLIDDVDHVTMLLAEEY